MNFNPIVLSIPVFFILIGIELVVERFSHRSSYRLPDAIANLSCGITSQVSELFMRVFAIGIYEIIYSNCALVTLQKTWLYWLGLFLLVDFAYYWAHRKSHEINLFWGGHVVHHQSEDYNLSVALRQSSFQVVWTFAFSFPIALLGFETLDFALVTALNTLYQFWIHTETINKLGWFEYVFNTPSHHRVHHGRNPKYIDKNHAGSLIIWDRMFGTFQKEEEKPTYGITKPINSWNAVWANFSHYESMAKDLKRIPSWTDKIKFIFKKPGWLPESMGGYREIPSVDLLHYRKYETPSPVRLNYYVLFQYMLCLGFTAFFLFNQTRFSLGEKTIIAALISLWVMNSGVLFENKRWVRYSEWIRIILYSMLLSGLIIFFKLNPFLHLAVACYFVISSFWFYTLSHDSKVSPV